MAVAQQNPRLPFALEDSFACFAIATFTRLVGQVHLGFHSWPSFVAVVKVAASTIASCSSTSKLLQHSFR